MSAAQVSMTPMTNQSNRSTSRVVKANASILSNCGYSPACLGHSLALVVMHEKLRPQLIPAVHDRYRCGAYARSRRCWSDRNAPHRYCLCKAVINRRS